MVEAIIYVGEGEAVVADVKVRAGSLLSQGKVVLLYKIVGQELDQVGKVKSSAMGRVVEVMVRKGETIKPGQEVVKFTGGCQHPTIMKDMCAECGADLRKLDKSVEYGASVAMVHAIPELKVSNSEAKDLGREDQNRLTQDRKLVLLVDLDQTLIHTTNDSIPPNLKDVYHFQLYGQNSPWYHTRVRPGTASFLQRVSALYELHICTFGARLYAHTIAAYLDPDKKFFSHRILSRDECFDNRSKTANMSALFPCGDSMVCIIDDREDVWNFAPNLVHVKPYHFFKHTGDINAPPGLSKRENDHDEKKEKKRSEEVELGGEDVKIEDSVQAEESSSEDEPQEESKVERRESIDMPSFDTNSRDRLEEDQRDRLEEDQNDRAPVEIPELTSDTSTSKAETKTDNPPVTPTDDVSDDLEISDSDSSSGIKSREISDTEEMSQEKTVIEEVSQKKTVKREEKSKEEHNYKDQSKVVDLEDNDDYLLYLEDILRTVHKAYYDLHDQSSSPKSSLDLKMVIPYVRKKTLQGVTIVLSGVVPTQVPLERSKPFLLARALGATVKRDVDKSTTHLVAARLGTAKVNDARRQPNVSIVTPDWLWACAERWERVEERLFTLSKTSSVTRRPPAHCSSPEIAFAERCP